jgi:hypothetical protein
MSLYINPTMHLLSLAAEIASRGIQASTVKTVELLNKGTVFVKSQLPAAGGSPSVIPPDVKETVEIMRDYTGQAVEFSGVIGI